MKKLLQLSTLIALVVGLSACITDQTEVERTGPQFSNEEYEIISQSLDVPQTLDNFSLELPMHMRTNGSPNMVPAAKALLGRVLFYDTQLSATGETNCASCHDQAAAFSDVVDFSLGINGQVTKRNSLALAATPNFSTSYGSASAFDNQIVDFFWDERASSIARQSRETIENEIEMGRDINDLANDLSSQELYRILAEHAFDTDVLRPEMITAALEVFCNAMVSADSRFDRLRDQEIFGENINNEPGWTPREQQGMALYRRDCAACHSADMSFPARATANNGLDVVYTDKGKGEIFGEQFNGIFKVPFLRNIELTGPYMHDGRFETLEEVIDHYSTNIQPHQNLSLELQQLPGNGQPKQFNYTEDEKLALITFLRSTTDDRLPIDRNLSDPFRP